MPAPAPRRDPQPPAPDGPRADPVDVVPLTEAAFAPWGRVIEAPPGGGGIEINDGAALRFHALAEIDVEGASPVISLFRARASPLLATALERHPFGTQAFFPLGGRPWLMVVADGPKAELHGFLCAPGQGVQIGRGVWHHPLLTLAAQDFLVVDRDAPEANVETARLDPPAALRL